MVKILKDVLISQDELARYFDGTVPVDLWRAMKIKKDKNLFALVETARILNNGRPRPADITIDEVNGEPWVRIHNQPRGISTFDKSGVPGGTGWEYYCIPKGTILPEGLAIIKDQYNTLYQATHYTIAPAYDMPLAFFKSLLRQLEVKIRTEVNYGNS